MLRAADSVLASASGTLSPVREGKSNPGNVGIGNVLEGRLSAGAVGGLGTVREGRLTPEGLDELGTARDAAPPACSRTCQ
jgi:hypothetical protein